MCNKYYFIVLGDPNTILRFSVLQEELIGLKKAVIFMVIMYHFERTYTKISKWKKYVGYLKSGGEYQVQASKCIFQGICLIFPAMMYDMCKMLPTKEAYWKPSA